MDTNTITDSKFFRGGNATFTVYNAEKKHYTYKIRQPSEGKPYFVSLLSGPNNESDYVYMGIYRPVVGDIILTQKSRYSVDSLPYKVVNWAIKQIHNNKPIPDGYGIHHEGKCCRCGRTLTTPSSVELGIGPECAKKLWE